MRDSLIRTAMKKQRILFVLLILVILASCNTPRYALQSFRTQCAGACQKATVNSGPYIPPILPANGTLMEKRLMKEPGYRRTRGGGYLDHFAIQAAYFYRWEKTTGGNDTATIRYNHNLGEFGIGYFTHDTERRDGFLALWRRRHR